MKKPKTKYAYLLWVDHEPVAWSYNRVTARLSEFNAKRKHGIDMVMTKEFCVESGTDQFWAVLSYPDRQTLWHLSPKNMLRPVADKKKDSATITPPPEPEEE